MIVVEPVYAPLLALKFTFAEAMFERLAVVAGVVCQPALRAFEQSPDTAGR